MDIFGEIVAISKDVALTMGKGYAECIYQKALCAALRKAGKTYAEETTIQITYNDIPVGFMRADIMLPEDKIVIENKAIDANLKLSNIPQVIVYMEHLQFSHGLIVNFIQNPSLEFFEVIQVLKVDKDMYEATMPDGRMMYVDSKGKHVKNGDLLKRNNKEHEVSMKDHNAGQPINKLEDKVDKKLTPFKKFKVMKTHELKTLYPNMTPKELAHECSVTWKEMKEKDKAYYSTLEVM